MTQAPAPNASFGVVIEAARPLSQSLIWDVQHTYYERSGITAWASGDVPHMLTSGPLIARAYARLISSFLADCRAGRLGSFDPKEPVYVLELGAGTGRLGHCMLRALARVELGGVRLVYVLSDRVRQNVEYWASHPALQGDLSSGRLELSVFDPSSDSTAELESGHQALGRGSLSNPMVVVANYFFDVMAQDLMSLGGGELDEVLVALCAEDDSLCPDDPEFFRRVFVATTNTPLDPHRYGDERDALLARLSNDEPAPRRRLFPALAIKAADNVRGFAGGRALFLVGERPGFVPDDPSGTVSTDEPEAGDGERRVLLVVSEGGVEAHRPGAVLAMGVHGGSMSLPVDLSILAVAGNAQLLSPLDHPTGLSVNALVYGATSTTVEVLAEYENSVAERGPEDLYLVSKAAITEADELLPLGTALAALRLGAYDPYLFRQLYRCFDAASRDVDEETASAIERALRRVGELDYPIDDSTDLAYGIASILAPAGRYEAAREFFLASRRRRGPRAETAYNLALCHLHLESPDDALVELDGAISLDPGYEAALQLRAMVLEESARRTTEKTRQHN